MLAVGGGGGGFSIDIVAVSWSDEDRGLLRPPNTIYDSQRSTDTDSVAKMEEAADGAKRSRDSAEAPQLAQLAQADELLLHTRLTYSIS